MENASYTDTRDKQIQAIYGHPCTPIILLQCPLLMLLEMSVPPQTRYSDHHEHDATLSQYRRVTIPITFRHLANTPARQVEAELWPLSRLSTPVGFALRTNKTKKPSHRRIARLMPTATNEQPTVILFRARSLARHIYPFSSSLPKA